MDLLLLATVIGADRSAGFGGSCDRDGDAGGEGQGDRSGRENWGLTGKNSVGYYIFKSLNKCPNEKPDRSRDTLNRGPATLK